MKSHKFILTVAILSLFSTLVMAPPLGTAFTYQGRLADGGAPANGSYDLTFTLYDDASGGTAVAGPLTNSLTSLSNGLFTVTLDFGGDVFDSNARWLGIGVRTNGSAGDFTLLSLRQKISASPYAIYASAAGTAGVAASASTATSATNVSGTVAVANGGTGSTTASAALNALGGASLAANSFTGIQSLNDNALQLRSSGVTLHALRYCGSGSSFAALAIDGPVLFGNSGGILGTVNGGQRSVLNWNSSGQVGIGFPIVSYTLQVNGQVAGVGNYVNVSDVRFKKDVATLEGALDKVMRLRAVTFDWRREAFPDLRFDQGRQIGFIAQEIRDVLPEVVSADNKGFLSVAYSEVVPVLAEALKDQQHAICLRDAEIAALKEKTAKLESRLEALEASMQQQFRDKP